MSWFVPEVILHCPLVENELKGKAESCSFINKCALSCKAKILVAYMKNCLFIFVINLSVLRNAAVSITEKTKAKISMF